MDSGPRLGGSQIAQEGEQRLLKILPENIEFKRENTSKIQKKSI